MNGWKMTLAWHYCCSCMGIAQYLKIKGVVKTKLQLVTLEWDCHYEKSCSLKPHYLAIKTPKKTCIQLLCNYPLGITTTMQLSFYKYGGLINKLPC